MRVSDEILMAFVDGELDPITAEEVRHAAMRDAGLARRAEEFRFARQRSKDAFAGILREPVPDRLLDTVLGGRPNVIPLRRRLLPQVALPLAASIAVLFGAGGYWVGQQQVPGNIALLGAGPVAQALGEISSGQTKAVAFGGGDATLETQAAYRVNGGLCRSFTLSGNSQAWRGVGCTRGERWTIELAAPAPSGDFAPASTGAAASIDAYLDAAGASEALTADEEKAALQETR